MSGMLYIPPYQQNVDYFQQEHYQQLLNTILSTWFNATGFYQPTLTNAEVTALLLLPSPPPVGTHWYNSDLDKMQFIGASAVQTITSV